MTTREDKAAFLTPRSFLQFTVQRHKHVKRFLPASELQGSMQRGSNSPHCEKNMRQKCFSSSCNSTCITFANWFQTCSVASGCSRSLRGRGGQGNGRTPRSLRGGKAEEEMAAGRLKSKHPSLSWVLGWARICSPRQLCHSSSTEFRLCFSCNLSELRALPNQSQLYKTERFLKFTS